VLAIPLDRTARRLVATFEPAHLGQGATMSDSRNPYAGIEALLTPQDSVLLLIDHQAF
jgi:hypothetical protein